MGSTWTRALRTRVVRAAIGAVIVGGIAAFAAAHMAPASAEMPTVASSSRPPASSTVAPTSTSSRQVIVASGTIVSVDPSAGTFVLAQGSGTQRVIDVSATTRFVGDVTALGQIQAGMQAQVTGQMLADGSLSALALAMQTLGD